jgi:hypothetical protein
LHIDPQNARNLYRYTIAVSKRYIVSQIYRVEDVTNEVQNAEQTGPRTLTPLLGSRGGGGGGVPICRCKIIGYRPRTEIGAKYLHIDPQEERTLYRKAARPQKGARG